MKITEELISEIAAKACSESHRPGSIFTASPWDCAKRAARLALEAALSVSPPSPFSAEGWTDRDVIDLVLAARDVAFNGPGDDELKALDEASEKFASLVPWDDEPEDVIAPSSPDAPDVSALVKAANTMLGDYQTSETHHPDHVLVPRKAFEAARSALASYKGVSRDA